MAYSKVMQMPDGRSKGCGIVEYATAEEAQAGERRVAFDCSSPPRLARDGWSGTAAPHKPVLTVRRAPAIETMNGREMDGRTIFVREDGGHPGPQAPRQPRKPRQPRQARVVSRAPAAGSGVPGTKVFVGNLSWETRWQVRTPVHRLNLWAVSTLPLLPTAHRLTLTSLGRAALLSHPGPQGPHAHRGQRSACGCDDGVQPKVSG